MEVIALTSGGVLIQATKEEVKEIINSVSGEKPQEIKIGQKIPAIDYASTIRKIKSLKEDSYFKNLISSATRMKGMIDEFSSSVEEASNVGK